ncbi:diaminopimelate epimerase [Rasiella rasia]|uniref:Diaminopimelate epimerase n=1 Tax=Rasiella rasia TaxID=2744027 RepID=A0A6G6GQF0_9FLAO|nr:diaminopimelate epimerase [Rasiella rasia]QIE60690.1 diaminopimelate epimerase [Rasiella rasia]
MTIQFYKYQGTGNDFILVDNRLLQFPKNNTKLVAQLCDRKFGIGADGLILLERHETADFTMIYYNSDGNSSSMCGNGGRCIVHFANFLGLIENETHFEAVDGMHEALLKDGLVHLKMTDVFKVSEEKEHTFVDTGSPHHVQFVTNLERYDVFKEGRQIRNNLYGSAGANVNFVEKLAANTFAVRTYERGVEDETLSCGTGVTAVAIAMHAGGNATLDKITLQQPGGELYVTFTEAEGVYTSIYLIGPATQVFNGAITI